MQISELLCRAEYIMRATVALRRRLSSTVSFHPPPPPLSRFLRRLSTKCCSYLPRPPILANCTLQLISDTVRQNKEREGAGDRQTSSRKLANAACVVTPQSQFRKKILLVEGKDL